MHNPHEVMTISNDIQTRKVEDIIDLVTDCLFSSTIIATTTANDNNDEQSINRIGSDRLHDEHSVSTLIIDTAFFGISIVIF